MLIKLTKDHNGKDVYVNVYTIGNFTRVDQDVGSFTLIEYTNKRVEKVSEAPNEIARRMKLARDGEWPNG